MAPLVEGRDVLVANDHLIGDLSTSIQQARLADVPGLLRAVLDREAWRERYVQRLHCVVTHARFIDFVTTAPLEGLGATVEILKNLCRDDTVTLDLLDRALQNAPGNPTGANQHAEGGIVANINNSSRPTGTSRTYSLRRLRKDRPDLHAQVLAGAVSAHRAMVQAGFRRVPTALEQLDRAWAQATLEERAAFLHRVMGAA